MSRGPVLCQTEHRGQGPSLSELRAYQETEKQHLQPKEETPTGKRLGSPAKALGLAPPAGGSTLWNAHVSSGKWWALNSEVALEWDDMLVHGELLGSGKTAHNVQGSPLTPVGASGTQGLLKRKVF